MTDATAETTVSVPTYSDAMAIVSTEEQHYDTIQGALASGKRRIHVHEITDQQTWPVETSRQCFHLSGDHGLQLEGNSGAWFKFVGKHKRPPGPLVEGFDIRGGGVAFDLQGVKYADFHRVNVEGCETGWRLRSTETNSPNSVTLRNCNIQKPTKRGIDAGPQAHSLVLDTVRVIHAGTYGLWANGPSCIEVRGGQYENCGEAGIKLQRCESPSIKDAYVEENGVDASDTKAEIILSDCEGAAVENCYFNGINNSMRGIFAIGADQPRLRNNNFRGYTGPHTVVRSD